MADETKIAPADSDEDLSEDDIIARHLVDQYGIAPTMFPDGCLGLVFAELATVVLLGHTLAAEVDDVLKAWVGGDHGKRQRALLVDLRDALAMQLARVEANLDPSRH